MTLREHVNAYIFAEEADPEMFEELMQVIRAWAIKLVGNNTELVEQIWKETSK